MIRLINICASISNLATRKSDLSLNLFFGWGFIVFEGGMFVFGERGSLQNSVADSCLSAKDISIHI